MTENEGEAWKQTIFYPFLHVSKYGRGIALQPLIHTTKHDTKNHCDVTDVEAIGVYNPEQEEVAIFAVNRNIEEDISFELDIRGFYGFQMKEYIVMESEDMKQTNDRKNQRISPKQKNEYEIDNGIFKTTLKRTSWNVIRLG